MLLFLVSNHVSNEYFFVLRITLLSHVLLQVTSHLHTDHLANNHADVLLVEMTKVFVAARE